MRLLIVYTNTGTQHMCIKKFNLCQCPFQGKSVYLVAIFAMGSYFGCPIPSHIYMNGEIQKFQKLLWL